MLSDSDSDGENEVQLTINEHFAKAYEYKKEREELSKLQDKYGSEIGLDDDESEDSEDNETEDEDGEELTPAMDAAILRTLARIKKKDPEIYNSKKGVFEEEQQKTTSIRKSRSSVKKEKSKPLHIKQHILNSTLLPSRSPSPIPALPTHAEEQVALRKETISAFHTAVPTKDEEDDDDDDLLIPREKTKDEMEQEEEEYREFLAREVGEDISKLVTVDANPFFAHTNADDLPVASTSSSKDKPKKKKGKGRKEETDQEFLMNYILNRGWIDHSDRRVPTYKEITSTRAPPAKTRKGVEIGKVEEDVKEGDADGNDNDLLNETAKTTASNEFDDDDFDDIADAFESSYNFRFEEPGAESIPTHPRNIESTVRRSDNPRKAARERKKERKEDAMLKKREEIKRLKSLKLKELKSKLERIGKEGGLEKLDDDILAQLDLDAEWDPEKHDKTMAEIYDDGGEGQGGTEWEKPTWDDDIDISDLLPGPSKTEEDDGAASSSKHDKKKKKKKKKAEQGDDAGVDVDAMDADLAGGADEGADEPEWDGTEETRKKILDAYVSQKLDALDFNDMIGDMPTRFHYTQVQPSSYGLTAAEILMAEDADLNSYVGLKKIAPYRKNKKDSSYGKIRTEPWDPIRQAKLQELRSKLIRCHRQFNVPYDNNQALTWMKREKKRMGKRERRKQKNSAIDVADESQTTEKQSKGKDSKSERSIEPTRPENGEPPKKKRKRKHSSTS